MHLITLVRLYRRMREFRAAGLGLVAALLVLSVLGNATCFYYFDGPTHDGSLEFGDAVWYSVISMTTIGYGDYSAQSTGARWGTFLFIIVLGMATFSVVLGMAIEGITDFSLRAQRGMSTAIAKDHILIVNFPSAGRVRQLIEELQSDPQHQGREIVVISDSIDSLPFSADHVLFVRGPVLEEQTYLRARVGAAKMAIVLATSYADANSDAVVASASAVIDKIHPEIHLVAECLNHNHKMLFDTVHCDAIVFSMKISGNLLAQEVHDPGIAKFANSLTSNVEGTTLFTAGVTEDRPQLCYNDLAKQLLDRDINLLCVNRDDDCLTSFVSLHPVRGDTVIYATTRRLDWRALLELCGK